MIGYFLLFKKINESAIQQKVIKKVMLKKKKTYYPNTAFKLQNWWGGTT